MTDHRLEGPGENGSPVPRDMPDQQAGSGEDPWEAAPRRAAPTRSARTEETGPEPAERGEPEEWGEPGVPGESEGADESPTAGGPDDSGHPDVPDTDEAGTGRQGAPHSGAVHPEHPVPDESPG